MEDLSNVQVWLTKVCGPRSRETYSKEIRNFAIFAKQRFGLDLNKFKEDYRTAKYAGEAEKERFLDRIHDIVEFYNCQIKESDYSSMHEALILSIIRSYLVKGCGMKDVEVPLPKHVFVKYHNRDLKKQDITRILDHSPLRENVFFLMMTESGMRPQTLVSLTYGNIKEDYEANKVPMKIDLPSLILKDNPSPRFTFIGEEAFRLLKEYLGSRGKLSDDDPLFLPTRPGSMKGEKLKAEVFSNSFGKIAKKAGLVQSAESREKSKPRPVRLYGLRKYFNNNMRTDRAYIEFWMGHTDAKQHYVSMDPEEHRQRYLEGYDSLKISETPETEKEIKELRAELRETKLALDIIKTFLTEEQLQKLQFERARRQYNEEAKHKKEGQP